jgi:hypothetical protein
MESSNTKKSNKMAGVITYLAILTLNVIVSTLQSKDKDW